MDYSLPGSSVHEILQARILEWPPHALHKGIFPDPGIEPMFPVASTLQVGSLLLSHQRGPISNIP